MRGGWIAAAAVLLAAWPGATAQAAGRCGDHPWCDTSLSPDRRADLLLAALTPVERIGLLGGDDASGVLGQAGAHTGTGLGVPRLDLPTLYLTDGPVGVRQGQSTALPSSIALAASFNRGLARRDGALVGNEAKLKGNDVVFAPTINLLRTPLWGRAFESLGEDPQLTAQLGVAWIRGAQAQGVIANVKHSRSTTRKASAGPMARPPAVASRSTRAWTNAR
ncbi:MAG: glycoside hydrolase family 3 protein [Thermoleophilaceae bacterium]|nr:glycoside hydrolase family 3 protein [Thermoleophilaceae bacterium]